VKEEDLIQIIDNVANFIYNMSRNYSIPPFPVPPSVIKYYKDWYNKKYREE